MELSRVTAEEILELARQEVHRIRRANLHTWRLIEADDIAQEVWITLLKDPEVLKEHDNPQGYIRLIARNRALNAARQNRRSLPADFEGDAGDGTDPTFGWVRKDASYPSQGEGMGDPLDEACLAETMDEWQTETEDILNSLPAHEGEVAALFYLAGQDSLHIGEALGIAPGTARQRLRRARRRLSDAQEALLRTYRVYHHPDAKRPQERPLRL